MDMDFMEGPACGSGKSGFSTAISYKVFSPFAAITAGRVDYPFCLVP
ncbi:hypothetical protein X474_11485 [Dethiosulfatarculus sandiegensis]|uniref:Uncharacterized protein n=1 Tax=Dethiosulfatarculus sandiegensis TaxID=1429043 RepID=A0A0D2HTQ6_9BACT|nr:hypothetical protein X474_11485 [Dethiosulfatarculus sandiegensis]